MAVVFFNVHKSFSGKKVLKGISCEIANNKSTVILGCSGSGKTTMAKIINGLVYPDSGSVLVDGLSLLPKNIKAIRNKIGFVLQSCNLFHNMNVIENIVYAPVHVMGKSAAETKVKANILLEKFGLINLQMNNVNSLSGGQKQRVAIIRSLIMDIKLLVMDEPTANLDPTMKEKFIQTVSELRKSNIGIIMVTHDVMLAQKIAENVIFVADGHVVENASSHDFFSPNFLHNDDVSSFLQFAGLG
ncbi:Polar amino acid ABC transporter ATP-binding protein [Candidatus Xenohaliotis californiensis]|uniref:Polar amino acid ABC transporter ATP-binding protein n=1 Tax=Candidatus Xenohaliotis californiensis TaxID=84677 RepID=A0ABM9N7D3_9RICK|nr:Polar amino acid ABC transporter ATP-binding protein [Candidatus Xenohaliotis californiensis]